MRRPRLARILTMALVVASAAGLLVGCQQPVRMWTACAPVNGDSTGTDGTYVLVCRNGRWEPIMTNAEYVQLRQGKKVTIAPLPTAPTTTSTTTSTSTTSTTSTSTSSSTTSTTSTSTTSTSTSSTTSTSIPWTARVDVTGAALGRVGIIGLSGAGSNYCDDATTCQVGFALPDGVQIQLSSPGPFTYTCPGSSPMAAMDMGTDYSGVCQQFGSITAYHVTVQANPV